MADAENPTSDDREARFGVLILHAHDLGRAFDELLNRSGNTEPVARDDLPAALLFELMHLTRLQFDALCHDLSDAWLSHAAPTHLRPVLEGLGHIAFVLGHETDHPVGSAAQRAACLALARVREEHQAMVSAHPDSVPVGNLHEGPNRIAFFEDLHARLACPYPDNVRDWPCKEADGRACSHRETWPCRQTTAAPRRLTTPTLRRLTHKLSFQFRDLEQASSLVLHLSLVDRMMVDAGPGTNALVSAPYAMRASTLAMGLSAYGQALVWVMETVDARAANILKAYIASTWKLRDMTEISTGVWDSAPSAT